MMRTIFIITRKNYSFDFFNDDLLFNSCADDVLIMFLHRIVFEFSINQSYVVFKACSDIFSA